jgi:hypothetical protein
MKVNTKEMKHNMKNMNIFHNKTSGKGWGLGYDPADIGYRTSDTRYHVRRFLRYLDDKLGRDDGDNKRDTVEHDASVSRREH